MDPVRDTGLFFSAIGHLRACVLHIGCLRNQTSRTAWSAANPLILAIWFSSCASASENISGFKSRRVGGQKPMSLGQAEPQAWPPKGGHRRPKAKEGFPHRRASGLLWPPSSPLAFFVLFGSRLAFFGLVWPPLAFSAFLQEPLPPHAFAASNGLLLPPCGLLCHPFPSERMLLLRGRGRMRRRFASGDAESRGTRPPAKQTCMCMCERSSLCIHSGVRFYIFAFSVRVCCCVLVRFGLRDLLLPLFVSLSATYERIFLYLYLYLDCVPSPRVCFSCPPPQPKGVRLRELLSILGIMGCRQHPNFANIFDI